MFGASSAAKHLLKKSARMSLGMSRMSSVLMSSRPQTFFFFLLRCINRFHSTMSSTKKSREKILPGVLSIVVVGSASAAAAAYARASLSQCSGRVSGRFIRLWKVPVRDGRDTRGSELWAGFDQERINFQKSA
ncbi:uncharacterized protein EV420DRAFT_1600996 [Desarmillaria tabescens]|uniref:Uncharacterized protein n=1 Tax=Armillaria tabescens TaxID=1929756 RepID=A0AA39J0L3_ARMTA|nr:uncharacterized protein EV420DRAFT_1600996 [Desarmillaria tabescens]KAK0433305.1 hypothetical protein EV420DRAFT_1600996 [Desarmillaria tabescens]